jgi:hypothetical protein
MGVETLRKCTLQKLVLRGKMLDGFYHAVAHAGFAAFQPAANT